MTQTATAQKERRVSRRSAAKSSTKVTCHKGLLGLGPNLAVKVLDLSETGVRMVIKAALVKGQEIEIGLMSQHHCRPIKMQANVAWCVAAADGTYCIGAQFQRGISYGALLDLTSLR